MPNIGGALTRKIGPLPAWGWGVAVGGALLAVKMLGGSKTSMTGTAYEPDQTQQGFLEGLSGALSDLNDKVDQISFKTAPISGVVAPVSPGGYIPPSPSQIPIPKGIPGGTSVILPKSPLPLSAKPIQATNVMGFISDNPRVPRAATNVQGFITSGGRNAAQQAAYLAAQATARANAAASARLQGLAAAYAKSRVKRSPTTTRITQGQYTGKVVPI